MHAHVPHTHAHACTHVHTHTCICVHSHTSTHARTHARTHTQMHRYTLRYIHTHTHRHTQTQTHARTHAYACAHPHGRIQRSGYIPYMVSVTNSCNGCEAHHNCLIKLSYNWIGVLTTYSKLWMTTRVMVCYVVSHEPLAPSLQCILLQFNVIKSLR